jgi:hypothetical protein
MQGSFVKGLNWMYRILRLGESAGAERGQGFKDSSKKDIRHKISFPSLFVLASLSLSFH